MLPGGRSPLRPAFPTEPVSQRPAAAAYEQQEAYEYQVCVYARPILRWSLIHNSYAF